jgi:uncharacterized membrane protein YeaQ/YmgE (transglycosylase-associated protein family)
LIGLLIKIFVCPAVVILASYIISGLSYISFYQGIIVGLILAVAGQMMEVVLLKRDTIWFSTFLDFVAATIIVYFVSKFLGAPVTFAGSLLVAALLAVTEYFQHVWLIRTGRTKKSET